jgi:hypothetical protein
MVDAEPDLAALGTTRALLGGGRGKARHLTRAAKRLTTHIHARSFP